MDSIAGVKTTKAVNEKENAIQYFENAPDSTRNRLLREALEEERQAIERILEKNAEN